jgi:hypothetical protein
MDQALPGDELNIRADDWNRVRQAIPRTSSTVTTSPFFCEIYYAKTGVSGIPARSTDTLGSGDVEIYAPDDSDVLQATGRTVTVKNISGTAVAAETYIIIGRENRRRTFTVIVESCEVES